MVGSRYGCALLGNRGPLSAVLCLLRVFLGLRRCAFFRCYDMSIRLSVGFHHKDEVRRQHYVQDAESIVAGPLFNVHSRRGRWGKLVT